MSNKNTRSLLTRLNHLIQAALVYGLFAVVRLFPIGASSWFGGWIGRTFGPMLSASKMARRNIKRAFPEKSEADVNVIMRGMWDNFGRVAFEFPNLDRFHNAGPKQNVELVNESILLDVRDDGKPGIIVTGHFANWELAHRSTMGYSFYLHTIYREFNNPLLRNILLHRTSGLSIPIPKGSKGAKMALQLLKDGEHIAILSDQKLNEGIALPFLGRDAMTAPALAQFALRYDCPVVPVRVERIKGAKYRITYYPPMYAKNTGDRHAASRAFMLEINQMYESWIRERPEQWLWLHRRWLEN